MPACGRSIDPDLVRAVEENRVEEVVGRVKGGTQQSDLYMIELTLMCGRTVLGIAAENNRVEMVRGLLEAGVGPDPPPPKKPARKCPSALHSAAKAGHPQVVKLLLDAGADPNYVAHHSTPLGKVLGVTKFKEGHFEVVQLLLAGGASRSYLHAAVPTRNTRMVELLLNAGADPNSACALTYAVRSGSSDMVKLLLDAGADASGAHSDGCSPPLRAAAQKNRVDLARMLMDAGANVNAADASALAWAAQGNHRGAVRFLIEAGADLEIPGWKGRTALINAAENNSIGLMRLLTRAGASVHATTGHGTTALMRAAIRGNAEATSLLTRVGADIEAENALAGTALLLAVRHKHPDVVRQLLVAGAEPNRAPRRGGGATALHQAAGQASPDLVKLLIEAGATASLPRQDGMTPLILASGGLAKPKDTRIPSTEEEETGVDVTLPNWDDAPPRELAKAKPGSVAQLARINIAEQLIRAGANVNAADRRHGITALHGAAYTNRPGIVRLLIEAGADPSLATKGGATALQMARHARHRAVVKILANAEELPR